MATDDQANELLKQFASYYYQTFQDNRTGLEGLFDPVNSKMTFEGKLCCGRVAIMEHLKNLPFQKVEHIASTFDAQITIEGGVLGVVMGQLKTDNDQPHSFSQTFYIKKDGNGQYCLLNSVFRLVLHNF